MVVAAQREATSHLSRADTLCLRGIEVVRDGRKEPFVRAPPSLSSAAANWAGLAVEEYSLPACVIPRHEHIDAFVHVVVRGSTKYDVLTGGRTLQFAANPGTIFLLPRGTIDELQWSGPTRRIVAAIHSSLFVNAVDEITHERDIELTQHWNLDDPNIVAVLRAMATDLAEGSPSGRLYGESLANALAVYLLKRYTARPSLPASYRGGLPGYRLKRVLDYVGEHLSDNLSLSELAAVAGMSPHYFADLFRKSVGQAPHRHVLLRRIEHAKQRLCDPKCTVIAAGLDAGFTNPSHFARVFRKFVGASPSQFKAETAPNGRYES